MISLNHRDYPDNGVFKQEPHEIYFNLRIYPVVSKLEKYAAVLNDIAEAAIEEMETPKIVIHGDGSDETMFIKDEIRNGNDSGTFLISYYQNHENSPEGDVILAPENMDSLKETFYTLPFHGKVLYLNQKAKTLFDKHFWYYFKDNTFVYDNLICYAMIIKNGGPLLEQVLTENLPFFDRWCILDTGSTDGTQETIKRSSLRSYLLAIKGTK